MPVLDCFEAQLAAGPVDFPQHHHAFHEWFLCTVGTGVQFSDAARMPMDEDDLFFFPSEIPHGACSDTPSQFCRGIVVYVPQDIFAGGRAQDEEISRWTLNRLATLRGEDTRLALSPAAKARLRELLQGMLVEMLNKQAGYELAMRLRLQEALLTIFRDRRMYEAMRAFAPPPAAKRIDDVLRYVRTHYRNPVRVDDMARMACLSRSHFHAIFKEHTGRTLSDYVNGVRIDQACRMLTEDQDPIAQIAFQCGFNNLSYFYQVFRDRTGLTPGAYAQANAGYTHSI